MTNVLSIAGKSLRERGIECELLFDINECGNILLFMFAELTLLLYFEEFVD